MARIWNPLLLAPFGADFPAPFFHSVLSRFCIQTGVTLMAFLVLLAVVSWLKHFAGLLRGRSRRLSLHMTVNKELHKGSTSRQIRTSI